MSRQQNVVVLLGSLQVRKQFVLRGKNEVVDKLAKLSSSQAMVPIGVCLQELHEPSISKALAKATKAAESSQETPPPNKSITELPKVMEIHSD
jgi:hypothetical protein